ncbi:DUF395 domain containing protein [Niveomyces insectorum RCEF 264]|uniref:DUF395 domain containing protein n=1 Tax=Niveomyces insectorum RCEF 264 TaxID=1081102 RepID=A0A162JG39_9HYPO|nr:DUF395 domain containing protein [Niveomyces insectorum RCEF 264]
MAAVVTGVVFGGALAASGVYQPSVILSQLKWENQHMLQAFLTATAASAIVSTAAQKLGYAQFSPRQYADRGWFAPYDGNVVGGLALGAGMALSGACPGTVLAQTALNIRSGYYALGGGLLGGLAWAALLRPAVARKPQTATSADAGTSRAGPAFSRPPLPLNIQGLLGVSTGTALVGLELVFAAIVYASVARFGAGPDARISPVLGGLLIGLAQLVSVAVRKTMLGVSTVYEDAGDWLLYATSAPKRGTSAKAWPPINSVLFSLGIVAGARLVFSLFPAFAMLSSASSTSPTAGALAVTPASAALGGFIMALGSRVAGGCTSGHGISGMALFSLSSYITMAATFVGGGLVAFLR